MSFAKIIPLTTRQLVTLEDVGPKVLSWKRFIFSILFPYRYGLGEQGSETILFPGVIALVLALWGFVKLNWKTKLVLVIFGGLGVLYAVGDKTSFFPTLVYIFPPLLTLRITTRFWFVFIFVASILAGKALNDSPTLVKVGLTAVILVEFAWFFNSYFQIHQSQFQPNIEEIQLIRQLSTGMGFYRIYCTTSCARQVYLQGKGLVGGYNPIQLSRFFFYAQRAAGFAFASYAVSFPPYQSYVDRPQPNSELMGVLAAKYVISPYEITSSGFELVDSSGELRAYENKNVDPYVYLLEAGHTKIPLTLDVAGPGKLEILLGGRTGRVVVSEIFTPFWKAQTNAGLAYTVKPHEDVVLGIDVTDKAERLTISFAPPLARFLLVVSLAVSLLAFISLASPVYFVFKRNKI
jgi:hypothetical protein